MAHLRQAIAVFPSSVGTRLDLGALLAQENRWDEAEEQFRAVLALDPRSALAHTDLGYIFYKKGRLQEAIAEHREALRLQPEFPLARANLELALRPGSEPAKPGSQP